MDVKYQCVNVVATGHTKENMSRHALLQWLNELLDTKVEKVENLCCGQAYCQIMDLLFPGCISMKKVKVGAAITTDFWNNFKQLQNSFRTVGCEKDIPIDKIIKGRFQENFEFLQWFKRFYDANVDVDKVNTVPKKAATSAQGYTRSAVLVSQSSPEERSTKSKITEVKDRAERLEQEKNFYFNKLRNIELLCTSESARNDDKETLISKILEELYATEEGFYPSDVEII